MKKKSSLTSPEQIADQLQSQILSGKLALGQKIPTEKKLGATFSVSRVLIREALQILKARGLVRSRRGSGNYVAPQMELSSLNQSMRLYFALSQEKLSYYEWMDLRILLEPFCVDKIIQANHPKNWIKIKAALQKMKENQSNLLVFGQADIEFHLAIIQASEHQLFTHLLSGALQEMGFKFARETYADQLQIEKNLKDHDEILQAIENHNSTLAKKILQQHLLESQKRLLGLKDL